MILSGTPQVPSCSDLNKCCSTLPQPCLQGLMVPAFARLRADCGDGQFHADCDKMDICMPIDKDAQELLLLQAWILPHLAQILKQRRPPPCSIHSRALRAQSCGQM